MVAQAREVLCHVEFQGGPQDAQNLCVSSADIKNAFRQIRIPGWLQAFFALLADLAPEVGKTGKRLSKNDLLPIP